MKSKIGIALVLGFWVGAAFAQDRPKPPVAPTPPVASSTEKIAADAFAQQINALESAVSQFEQEFQTAHPGWQMNLRTGQLVQIKNPDPKIDPKPAVK